jgi:prepilin peptidase CpaA
MSITIWLTLVAACIAVVYDLRARRIPNALTGSLAGAAVIVHAFGGWQTLAVSLAVMGILTLGGALLYSRGGLGGGDVKLAIAASGMLSYPTCLSFLLYTAIAGGFLALYYLTFRGEARAVLSRVALVTAGAMTPAAGKRATLPYAIAFACGALAVALSQSVAPFLRIMPS